MSDELEQDQVEREARNMGGFQKKSLRERTG